MKSPIEYLQDRIIEMENTIAHVSKQQIPLGWSDEFFELHKKRDLNKIRSEISGYKLAIRILEMDKEMTIFDLTD